MPTITPNARPQIGGTTDFIPTRTSVKASTGMEIQTPKELPPPTPDPKTGQSGITEETTTPAVTLSPQLTALARKQQKLQQEIQAQRDKEAAFEARTSDYVPKGEFKAKLQTNAAEALADLGLDYTELTNLLLAQQQGDDPVQALKAEVQQLKASQEENVSKQYEATLKQYRSEADSLVASDPKSYFLINKGNHQDAVVQHILDTWKEDDSKILSVAEAAKEIEEFLRDEARAKKALLEELEGPPAEKAPEKTLPPPKAPTRTLTNSVDTAPSRAYNGQFQHLSPKERLAQAIARAQK